jgi:hypothetical protein
MIIESLVVLRFPELTLPLAQVRDALRPNVLASFGTSRPDRTARVRSGQARSEAADPVSSAGADRIVYGV